MAKSNKNADTINYDIKELLEIYRAGGPDSEQALVDIVNMNLGLIGSIIEKYYHSYAAKHYADLFSCGKVGLMQAINKYDPTKSRPSTYFTYFIRHEMYDYVTGFLTGVSSHKAKRVIKVSMALERLEDRGIVNPSVLDVVCEIETMGYEQGNPLKIDEYKLDSKMIEDAILIRRASQNKDYVSEEYLDDLFTQRDEYDENPETAYLRKEKEEVIYEEFTRLLDDTEQLILTRIHNLDGKNGAKTHEKLAEELGIPVDQVRSIHNQAIRKLKNSRIADFYNDHLARQRYRAKSSLVQFKPSMSQIDNQYSMIVESDEYHDDDSIDGEIEE